MTPDQQTFHENIKQICDLNKRAASDKFAKIAMEASVKKCALILEIKGFKVHPDTIDILKQDDDLCSVVFHCVFSVILVVL